MDVLRELELFAGKLAAVLDDFGNLLAYLHHNPGALGRVQSPRPAPVATRALPTLTVLARADGPAVGGSGDGEECDCSPTDPHGYC